MVTYLISNLIFMVLTLVIFRIHRAVSYRHIWITLTALLALTTIFDNLIIHFDIVAYDTGKLLGLYIVNAPIEDFFYCLLVAFLIPTLWHTLGKNNDK